MRESSFVKNHFLKHKPPLPRDVEEKRKVRAVRLAGGQRTKMTYTQIARYFLAEEDRKAKKTRAERMLDEIYEIVTNKDNPPSARVQAAEWLRKVAFGDTPKPPQVIQVVETLQQALPESDFIKLVEMLKGEASIEDATYTIESGQDNTEKDENSASNTSGE